MLIAPEFIQPHTYQKSAPFSKNLKRPHKLAYPFTQDSLQSQTLILQPTHTSITSPHAILLTA